MHSDRSVKGGGPGDNALPVLVPIACAGVIVLASRLRFGEDALRFASPFPAPAWAWSALAVVLAAAAFGIVWRSRRAMSRPAVRRALAELSVYPLALAVVWGLLPPYTQQYREAHYLLAAVVLLAFAFLLWRDRAGLADWGLTRRRLGAALRDLALPTAVLLAAGLMLAALTTGLSPRWQRMAVNVFTYPLSAVVQLLLLQVLLIRRCQELSDSRALIVLSAAAVFALAHWPNPPLVLGCFLGALVWAQNFLRHRNLWAIALSMGVLAAVLGNAVSREAIDNARTGPIFIQRKIDAAGPLRMGPDFRVGSLDFQLAGMSNAWSRSATRSVMSSMPAE